MKRGTNSEAFLARKTAEEYRSKGYEVSEEILLEFLPGSKADMIVQKNDETKLIEVRSRSSLAADQRIRELAQIINSKPGWSFELVLAAEPQNLDSPEGAHSFERESVLKRVEDAEEALNLGLSDAAFLLAWSACEAAIRNLVADHGVSSKNITRAGHVLDQAVFLGIISRDDYQYLKEMNKYRNAIVHAFSVGEDGDEMVTDLLKTVRRMLSIN